MVKIAVFVSGGGTNLQSLIDYEKAGNLKNGTISLVVSNRMKAYGLERAKAAGIEAVCIKEEEELLKKLEEKEIDLIVLAGYLAIIPEEMIARYQNRIINIHPSLIPSFCGKGFYGLHVHEAALKRGVKVSGATTHFVSEVVDGGPIILQESIDVSTCQSAEQMQQLVLAIEHRILPKSVSLYCENRLEVKEGKVIIK